MLVFIPDDFTKVRLKLVHAENNPKTDLNTSSDTGTTDPKTPRYKSKRFRHKKRHFDSEDSDPENGLAAMGFKIPQLAHQQMTLAQFNSSVGECFRIAV